MDLSIPPSARGRHMERSCDSRCSRSSRISQLSQRSQSRQQLSTEEIEQIRAEQGRQQVKSQIEMNRRKGRQAIVCPQLVAVRRSLKVTEPKEFNLSCPATPNRSFSDGETGETPAWDRSLRQPSAPPAWKPSLTVPLGPQLLTSERSSRTPSRDSTPRKRSMSRHRNPREQEAIERHLDRTAAGQFLQETPNKHVSCKIVRSSRSQEPIRGRSLAQAMAQEGEVRSSNKHSIEVDQVSEPDSSCLPASHDTAGAPAPTMAESSSSLEPPEGANLDDWIDQANTPEERAERRRIVAIKMRAKKGEDLKIMNISAKEKVKPQSGKRMVRRQPKQTDSANHSDAAPEP